jgi:D-arginine dehydrogenase
MGDRQADILIIGAGMAGLSLGAELSRERRVIVLERENQPGYHATGRSAALFMEAYGPPVVRALARASRPFLSAPPAGFAEHALLESCGLLLIARSDQLAALEAFAAQPDVGRLVHRVDAHEARRLRPCLRNGYVAAALSDPTTAAIDVASLLQGYRATFRRNGGILATNAEATAVSRKDGRWRAETTAGPFTASILVNAAGAWADELAVMAGIRPIGLEPRRRSVAVVEVGASANRAGSGVTADIEEEFYFRPEGNGLLLSPADETLSPPCDAQPEELDIAIAVDRLARATDLEVRRVSARWAGLRSFVADRDPVAGFAPDEPSFFWLAGQGGYGIQVAPALAQLGAALIEQRPLSIALTEAGVAPDQLSPARPALTAAAHSSTTPGPTFGRALGDAPTY